MHFPEIVVVLGVEKAVVFVGGDGVLKGKAAEDECEDEDAEGKDIGFVHVVGGGGGAQESVKLGCHETTFSAFVGGREGGCLC